MSKAFEAYKEYLALKQHFQGKYDYQKYSGKLSVKESTFEARKDKLFFQKLAKHPDWRGFLIANLSKDEKSWIRTIAYSEESERIYKNWLRKQQSLQYLVKQDLDKLEPDFNKNFIVKNNEHPPLLKMFLSNDIQFETFCVLVDCTGAMKYWCNEMPYCPIWSETQNKV